MSIEKHKAFLDSLDGEKGLPEKMHGWDFDDDLERIKYTINNGNTGRALDYLFERIRRAESCQIPDLKERVKELMRDAMDAQAQHQSGMGWTDANKLISEFRAICAPEVKP